MIQPIPVATEVQYTEQILKDLRLYLDKYGAYAIVGNRPAACLALRQAADSLFTAAQLLLEAEKKAKDPSNTL